MTATLVLNTHSTWVCRQNMRFEQEVNEASPLTHLITSHGPIEPRLRDMNQPVSIQSPEVPFQIINPARGKFKRSDRVGSDNHGTEVRH